MVLVVQILGNTQTRTYIQEHSIVDPEEKRMELCSTNVGEHTEGRGSGHRKERPECTRWET